MERPTIDNAQDIQMNTDQLQSFLSRYVIEYDVEQPRTVEICSIGQFFSHVVTGKPKVKLTLDMCHLEDLVRIDQLHDERIREANLRINNPAAQKAWDNYRTIMGLIK